MATKDSLESEQPQAPPPPVDSDPVDSLVARARDIIAKTGRTALLVYVRQDGREFPNQIRLANVEQLDDLATKIFERFGSGDFDYRVRVGGAFACGWLPISIADDPEAADGDDDEDLDEDFDEDERVDEEDEPEERPLSPSEVIAAATDELERRQAARRAEEERERARERSIQEPLLARIAELERLVRAATSAPPAPPPASPEILALKATVDALQAQIKEKDRATEKKERDALEERFTKRLDDIQAVVAAPKKKRKKDPLEAALEHLTKIAIVDKTLETLKARAGDNEGNGGLLEDSIKVFEEPLKNIMKDAAKQLEKTAKSTLRSSPSSESGGSAAPRDDVPSDIISWLQLVFKQQHLVLDVEFVRASIAKPVLGASLERLASCTSVEQLYVAVNDLLGDTVLAAIKKEPPEYSKGIVQLCAALAKSIHTAKTTPAPKPDAEKEKPAP